MQKLLAIGTVGKKIAVTETERARKFDFWVNVNEKRKDADGNAYTVTTAVRCMVSRPLADMEFGKSLTPGCGVIVRGLAEPILVTKDGKQFGALTIKYADAHVVGRDVQSGMNLMLVGYVGMVDTNTVKDMCVCNFSVAENLLDKSTGEVRALWMRCALWRKPDKCSVFDYIRKGQLVGVSAAPYVRLYEDKTGETRVSLECRVEDLELLGGRKDGDPVPSPDASGAMADDPAEAMPNEPDSGVGATPQPKKSRRMKMQPPAGIGWNAGTDDGAAADDLPF